MAPPQRGNKKSRGQGRQHVLEKLKERVGSGDYYGALQMYKTLYSRHFNQKEYNQAVQMALSACKSLIEYDQVTASVEMGCLMIESYTEGKMDVSMERKADIKSIVESFRHQRAEGPELASFLRAAVKWSAKYGSRLRGDPELQLLLSEVYLATEDYAGAAKHYVHTEKPLEFSTMLVKWSQTGHKSEQDLFLARGVLQLLSLENLRDANIVFDSFLQSAPVKSPLINFLRFLLVTLERKALPLFQLLQQKYAPSLLRDASFQSYMGYIGQKFYGIKPPQTGLSALMNLFGGGL